jgi:PAS domain S-box-containing protein
MSHGIIVTLMPAIAAAVLVVLFITSEYSAKRWWRRRFRGHYFESPPPGTQPEAGRPGLLQQFRLTSEPPATPETGAATEEFARPLSFPNYFGQRIRKYVYAVVAVSLAVLVRLLLDPVLNGSVPYSFFLVATIVVAWNLGVGETLLAVLLGFIAGSWFFVEPFHSFAISQTDDRWSAALFLFIGLAIVVFKKSMEIAWLRAMHKDIESLRRRKTLEHEEALFEQSKISRELLATAMDTARDPTLTLTPDGTITSWNLAAEQLLGFPARQTVGRPLALIVPAEFQPEQLRLLDQANRDGRTRQWQTTLAHRDGTPVPVSLSISPAKDRAGKPVGAVVVIAPLAAGA